jgi:hypothetical protein
MLFLRQPIALSAQGIISPTGLKRLTALAWKPLLVEV